MKKLIEEIDEVMSTLKGDIKITKSLSPYLRDSILPDFQKQLSLFERIKTYLNEERGDTGTSTKELDKE